MSAIDIRRALETQLSSITPAIPIAWENERFTAPAPDQAYAAAYLLLAQPANPEMGPLYIEQGIFQVNLYYPSDQTAADAMTYADAIRSAFRFATSLVVNGTVVNITGTPEIGPGQVQNDRYFVPVKVRFQSFQGE